MDAESSKCRTVSSVLQVRHKAMADSDGRECAICCRVSVGRESRVVLGFEEE